MTNDIKFTSADAFDEFRKHVATERRHFFSPKTHDFLTSVRETTRSRRLAVPARSSLWRAQLGCLGTDKHGGAEPYGFVRMLPPRDKAREGRLNPKGIPIVYTACDEDTAMIEVRPDLDSTISLAELRVVRELTIVHCAADQPESHLGRLFRRDSARNVSIEKREMIVWGDINAAFACPVTGTDSQADYVATQILAELFRDEGFDGVAYRSSLGKGYNIAIFDLNAVEVVSCRTYGVEDFKMTFGEAGHRYTLHTAAGERGNANGGKS